MHYTQHGIRLGAHTLPWDSSKPVRYKNPHGPHTRAVRHTLLIQDLPALLQDPLPSPYGIRITRNDIGKLLIVDEQPDGEFIDYIVEPTTLGAFGEGTQESEWLPASQVTDYNPDQYDFEWNTNHTLFCPHKLRWHDDASYIRYQGDSDAEPFSDADPWARDYAKEAKEIVNNVRKNAPQIIQFPLSSWASGATFRIKTIAGTGREYNLAQVDSRTLQAIGERQRYGRKAQIIEDVAYVLEYGTLPPASGPRW